MNETRAYNTMGGLGSSLNISHGYSSSQNNGQIHDALNRLASAAATSGSWGKSYAYEGFGNLTDQIATAGTAPTLRVVYSASNNLQTTDCADANGLRRW